MSKVSDARVRAARDVFSDWYATNSGATTGEAIYELARDAVKAADAAGQHTECAICHEDKPTPLRIDQLGGYVCLTCIDRRLTAAIEAVSSIHEAEPVAQTQRITRSDGIDNDAWERASTALDDAPDYSLEFHTTIARAIMAATNAERDRYEAQCCVCGKKGLSIVEGDGGAECQLEDGRWTCSQDCYYTAVDWYSARPVSVRALEWFDADGWWQQANTVCGHYVVGRSKAVSHPGWYWRWNGDDTPPLLATEDDAKAAAQAHFNARVLSCLSHTAGEIEAGGEVAEPTRYFIEHDGFVGTVIGRYTRLDGKHGVVMQQDGTNIVHVYGAKWLKPAGPTLSSSSQPGGGE